MNKNTFFVIEEEEIETGRLISYAMKVHNCNNLLGYFTPRKGMKIISINACDTWKEAQEIAHFWNDCAEKNGNYLFQRTA